MIRKILAALDGSKTSESILPYLESLLRFEDADVTLVKVLPSKWIKEKDEAQKYLRHVAERLGEKGACVNTTVLYGDPAAQLTLHAAEKKCDLLLLCTHGRTGLKRLLMGSVAEKVLRKASTPVLIAHPLEKESPPPRIRRIVVPLDGFHRASTVLPVVARLAKATQSSIALVTVVSATAKNEMPVEVLSQNLFRQQKELERQGLTVELAVPFGDPAQETLSFAELNHADLVAIATHGRSGLERFLKGSVTEGILRKTRMPLLVVRTDRIEKEHPVRLAGKRHRDAALESGVAEKKGAGTR
jgi:nucleotide-binding universal stress UspA family protein